MEAVAAVTHQDFIALLYLQSGTLIVGRPLPDGKQPEHQALVAHGVVIVKLRFDLTVLGIGMVRVQPVRAEPGHRSVGDLLHTSHHIRMLEVGARAPHARLTDAEAEDPLFAKRIVMHGRPITDSGRADGHGFGPVNAVGRTPQRQAPPSRDRRRDKHLETSLGVGVVLIEPHRTRIAVTTVSGCFDAPVTEHLVRARTDIERRLIPVYPVPAGRQTRAGNIAPHIPDLKQVILRIVKGAVAERRGRTRGILLLPGLIRPQDRIFRIIFRQMVAPLQRRTFDQKIIHE